MSGIAAKKIMIVPWAEKIWLNAPAADIPGASKATACCERIMIASMKPRSSITQREQART